jgi:hypothetical protein
MTRAQRGCTRQCSHLVGGPDGVGWRIRYQQINVTVDPTVIGSSVNSEEDNITVVTLNVSAIAHIPSKHSTRPAPPSLAATARQIFGNSLPQYLNAITIAANQMIADTGATSIFITDGVDMVNKWIATKPLTINLPDGTQVMSMHTCNINTPGLPTVLTGHIASSLKVASLIGICPICKAGCKVLFDNKKCNVIFNGNVILQGVKDPVINSWTLPLPTMVYTAPGPTVLP